MKETVLTSGAVKFLIPTYDSVSLSWSEQHQKVKKAVKWQWCDRKHCKPFLEDLNDIVAVVNMELHTVP